MSKWLFVCAKKCDYGHEGHWKNYLGRDMNVLLLFRFKWVILLLNTQIHSQVKVKSYGNTYHHASRQKVDRVCPAKNTERQCEKEQVKQ